MAESLYNKFVLRKLCEYRCKSYIAKNRLFWLYKTVTQNAGSLREVPGNLTLSALEVTVGGKQYQRKTKL